MNKLLIYLQACNTSFLLHDIMNCNFGQAITTEVIVTSKKHVNIASLCVDYIKKKYFRFFQGVTVLDTVSTSEASVYCQRTLPT